MSLNDVLTEIAFLRGYIEKFKNNNDKESRDTLEDLEDQLDQLLLIHDEIRASSSKEMRSL